MIARSLLAAAFFAVLAAASPLFADQLALLREVRATGGGGEPRVELIVDRPVPFVTYTMPELRRAVIDLPGVEPAEVKNPIPVGSGMIDKVTIQKKRVNDVPLTRVIIHLQRDAEVSIAADAADGRKIVALLRAARQAPVTAPPTAKAPQPLPPAPHPP
ncbi:MAG TPA: AMIN domain-containing protein, partial [Geobacteraceae bacterium]